jgi:hypothetical protein
LPPRLLGEACASNNSKWLWCAFAALSSEADSAANPSGSSASTDSRADSEVAVCSHVCPGRKADFHVRERRRRSGLSPCVQKGRSTTRYHYIRISSGRNGYYFPTLSCSRVSEALSEARKVVTPNLKLPRHGRLFKRQVPDLAKLPFNSVRSDRATPASGKGQDLCILHHFDPLPELSLRQERQARRCSDRRARHSPTGSSI